VPLRRSASGSLGGWGEGKYISAVSATTSVYGQCHVPLDEGKPPGLNQSESERRHNCPCPGQTEGLDLARTKPILPSLQGGLKGPMKT